MKIKNKLDSQKSRVIAMLFSIIPGFVFSVCLSASNSDLSIESTKQQLIQSKNSAYQWINTQTIFSLDGETDDAFGQSIAVSGTQALVGAVRDDANGINSGSVYYYEFNGINWVEKQMLTASDGALGDAFGIDVSMKGNWAVIGAYKDRDGQFIELGSAYIFEFTGSIWEERQKIRGSGVNTLDRFGQAVLMLDNMALVSTVNEDQSRGVVYVFTYDGNVWSEVQSIQTNDLDLNTKLGISLSAENNRLAIGSNATDEKGVQTGAVFMFEYIENMWVETQKVLPEDRSHNMGFGQSVDLKGDQLIIGSSNDSSTGFTFEGSAYVFEWNGLNWEQVKKLNASDGTLFDHFGSSVSQYGNRIIIASSKDDGGGCVSGAVYEFEFENDEWTEKGQLQRKVSTNCDRYGYRTVLTENQVLVSAINDGAGTVLFFDGNELIYKSSFED